MGFLKSGALAWCQRQRQVIDARLCLPKRKASKHSMPLPVFTLAGSGICQCRQLVKNLASLAVYSELAQRGHEQWAFALL